MKNKRASRSKAENKFTEITDKLFVHPFPGCSSISLAMEREALHIFISIFSLLLLNLYILRYNIIFLNLSLLVYSFLSITRRLFFKLIMAFRLETPLYFSSYEIQKCNNAHSAHFAYSYVLGAGLLYLLSLANLLFQCVSERNFTNLGFLFYPIIFDWWASTAMRKKVRYTSPEYEVSHGLKRIFLETCQIGYFGGFLPLRLMSFQIYLEPIRLAEYSCLLSMSILLLKVADFVNKRASDLYDYAISVGEWAEVQIPEQEYNLPNLRQAQYQIYDYNPMHHYFNGTYVRHASKIYKALDQVNTCEPSSRRSLLLRTLFMNPLKSQLIILEASTLVALITALDFMTSFHIATPFALLVFCLSSVVRQYFLMIKTKNTVKRPRRFL